MLDLDDLRRMMRHIGRIAELESDPGKVRELRYLAGLYKEELREAEGRGGYDARLVALLPSV